MNPDYYQPRHSLHQGKFINDGFFPDLDLVTLQKRYRIDSQLSIEALYGAVLASVMLLNRELYPWACSQAKLGYDSLATVPAPEYGFQAPPTPTDDLPVQTSLHYVSLYEHAVFARVKGDLTRENSHHTLTNEGMNRQVRYHDLSDEYYCQSVWAVRQIKGKPTTRWRLL